MQVEDERVARRLEQLIIEPPQAPGGATGRRQARKKSGCLPDGVARATGVANLFTCAIEFGKLSTVQAIVTALVGSLRAASKARPSGSGLGGLGGGGSCRLAFKKKYAFHCERPNWKSDIRWVSAANEDTLGFFQELFDRLDIASSFAFLGQMTLLSGYLVVRQCTQKSHFHSDFSETGGKAFTLMTPLQDMSDLEACHLLARLPRQPVGKDSEASGGRADALEPAAAARDGADDCGSAACESAACGSTTRGSTDCDSADCGRADGGEQPACEVCQYRYELGRAIVFGDDFIHATQTGDAPQPLAFLCFTFGDRSMSPAEWSGAEHYISQQ